MNRNQNSEGCSPVTTGKLPQCGMLAVSYVPVQRNTEDSYGAKKALSRGTLFPGLDLPYRGLVNNPPENPTPIQELMALGFAVHELGLYLDTHGDSEAEEMFLKYNKLYQEGVAEYQRRYGPLQMTDSGTEGFEWVNDPWPWELAANQENHLDLLPQKEV